MGSRCAFLLLLLYGHCHSYIHWMVTEDGKIEYQDDTPYDLRKPFDLVGFMQQEARYNKLKDLEPLMADYGQLLKQYDDGSPEKTIRNTDRNCLASIPIAGYDFYISSLIPIAIQQIYESYLSRYIKLKPGRLKPYCDHIPLPFSMSSMEHLDGVQRSRELGGMYKAEPNIKEGIHHSVENYGHFVTQAMRQNSTSWVLFNFAAIYWRYKGEANNVIECAKRALYYSPIDQMDVALLHMASVLQKSKLLADAAAILEVASSLNSSNLLYRYVLAGIYVRRRMYNKSLEHIEKVLEVEPDFKDGRSLWHAIHCEKKLHETVSSFSEKFDEARNGIDTYSTTYSDLQRHQVIPSKFDIPGLDTLSMPPIDIDFSGPSVRNQKQHQHHKQHKQQNTSSYSVKKDKTSDSKLVHNKTTFTDGRDGTTLPETANSTAKHNKQLPGHEGTITDGVKDQSEKSSEEGKTKKKRRQKPRVIFNPEDDCKKSSKLSYVDEDDETDSENDNTEESIGELSEDIKSDGKLLEDLKSNSDKSEKSSTSKTPSDVGAQQQFTDSYQTSEFRPYNPLPHALEEKLFPRPVGPANFFAYPSWPDKTECLDVVENLSSWVKSSRMDIDITQRGHNYEQMFAAITPNTPSRMMKTPHCYNIVELSYTIHAMDHLSAIAKRKLFDYTDESIAAQYKDFIQDGFLRFFAVKGATEVDEAGKLIYAGLLRHGPNHALFSLAGFYWRLKGNTYQAIECYRRAAHFAPLLYKDVAYIALANVMLDIEALEEAAIFARAAVDIRPHELISQYTYALTLSSIGELDGCSLHLRFVLTRDAKFPGALEYLRTVRCYVKFERERVELEKQHKQLLARQAALDKKREDLQKEFELILERADLLLDQENVLHYIETLEEKRKEISALADIDNYDKIMELTQDVYEEGSETAVGTNKKCKDCDPATSVNTVTGDYIEHYTGQAAIEYFSSIVVFLRKKELTADDVRNYRKQASITHRKKLFITSDEIDTLQPATDEQKQLLSFPNDDDCEERLNVKRLPYTNTWLSLASKGINITDHVNFNATLPISPQLPHCTGEVQGLGPFTLDTLDGVGSRNKLSCPAEKHLKLVLFSLDTKANHSLEEMGSYLTLALEKDPGSWQVTNLAALYWRVVGRPDLAIECLRIAMQHAPEGYKDIALISAGNVLYKSGYISDAVVCFTLSMEYTPGLVIAHVALADILAIKGEYYPALRHYKSALEVKPDYLLVLDRIRTIQCILGEHRHKPHKPDKLRV